MDSVLIFLFLYAILLLADLIPTIRKKKKKALYFYIPVFLLTLVINLMQSFGFQFPTLDILISQCLSIFHMQ